MLGYLGACCRGRGNGEGTFFAIRGEGREVFERRFCDAGQRMGAVRPV